MGIKAEMWKTKHPNLTVLETGEDTPVLVRFVLSMSVSVRLQVPLLTLIGEACVPHEPIEAF